LRRVEEALGQLDAGTYGRCFQCGVEISETRLLALPFAVRCKTCEERREQVHAQTQRRAEQHSSFLSLSDMG
jgi:DnaK suppressor protein